MTSEEVIKATVLKALIKIKNSEISIPQKLEEYFNKQPSGLSLTETTKGSSFNPKYMPYDQITGFGRGIPINPLKSSFNGSSSTELQDLTPAMQTRNSVLGLIKDVVRQH